MITEQKLRELVTKVQESFLTSNNIIDRIKHPYYFNHPDVPEPLTTFKQRIQNYRQRCAEIVTKQPARNIPNAPDYMCSFTPGSFAHEFLVALTVSKFGIGDCGECTDNLGLELIQADEGNLAFVTIELTDAQLGMEKYHAFIVANLPKLSKPFNQTYSVYEFFKSLPQQCLIADAFLGLVFPPHAVPDKFVQYMDAYGGKTKIIQCPHFYNVTHRSMLFDFYPQLVKEVESEVRAKHPMLTEDMYFLEQKQQINDTRIIHYLKELTRLPFFAVRDEKYRVDAVIELVTTQQKTIASNLQCSLKGHGRFFNIGKDQEIFVLEGINLTDENPKLIQFIRTLYSEQLKNEGNELFKRSQFEDALKKYQEAIQVNHNLETAWFNAGLMHKKLNQHVEATIAFRKTLELNPNHEKARFHLASTTQLTNKQFFEAWKNFSYITKHDTQNIDAALKKLQCEQQFAARVVFANVDLKLTKKRDANLKSTKENEIKILEFGRGMQSGSAGLTNATGENIVAVLANKFKQLSLPTLVLNNFPGLPVPYYDELKRALPSLPILENEFLPDRLESYRAVYGGMELEPVDERILLMDDIGSNFIFEDKGLIHDSFVTTQSLFARPRCLKFEKKLQPDLAKQICEQMPDVTLFVVKAPDLEGGKGVLIVEKGDLETTLNCLLATMNTAHYYGEQIGKYQRKKYPKATLDELFIKMQSTTDKITSWRQSESSYFLVEEYITNIAVNHNNNIYDATMRVFFIITREYDDKLTFAPLGCYWKLPPQPINYRGDLHNKTVSSFSPQRHDAIAVSEQDKKTVYKQLEAIIPNLINEMIKRDIPTYIESQKQETTEQKKYKSHLYLTFANGLTQQGQYLLAEHYLTKAKALTPSNEKIFHELGFLYHMKKDYSNSEKFYNHALKINPKDAAIYYRRGKLWLVQNQLEKAQNDFEMAKQLSSSYQKYIDITLQEYHEYKSKQKNTVYSPHLPFITQIGNVTQANEQTTKDSPQKHPEEKSGPSL